MARTYSPTYNILNYTTFYISINNRILIVPLYNAADELNIEDVNTDNKEERKLYSNFIYSIGNENTRNCISNVLKYHLKFLDVNTLQELVNKPQKLIESDIKDYIIYLRNRRKIAYTIAINKSQTITMSNLVQLQTILQHTNNWCFNCLLEMN